MIHMNTSEAISIIYSVVEKIEGPVEARKFISIILNNVIDDLQIDGISVSAMEIDKRLSEKAQAYKDIADEQVA